MPVLRAVPNCDLREGNLEHEEPRPQVEEVSWLVAILLFDHVEFVSEYLVERDDRDGSIG
jgi:hypothetical protein